MSIVTRTLHTPTVHVDELDDGRTRTGVPVEAFGELGVIRELHVAGVTLDLSRLDAEAGRDGELYLYAGEAQALATAILNALAPQGA